MLVFRLKIWYSWNITVEPPGSASRILLFTAVWREIIFTPSFLQGRSKPCSKMSNVCRLPLIRGRSISIPWFPSRRRLEKSGVMIHYNVLKWNQVLESKLQRNQIFIYQSFLWLCFYLMCLLALLPFVSDFVNAAPYNWSVLSIL